MANKKVGDLPKRNDTPGANVRVVGWDPDFPDGSRSHTRLLTDLQAATVAPHTHTIANTTGLQAALDAKADAAGTTTALAGKAATSHTHAQSDVTGLVTDLAAKAPLASPTFTGTPTLPTGTVATTQSPGDNTTKVATTAFAAALGALKADLASPTFTGTPTLPTGTVATTQAAGDSSTKLATTAFVAARGSAYTNPLIINTTRLWGDSDGVIWYKTGSNPSSATDGLPFIPDLTMQRKKGFRFFDDFLNDGGATSGGRYGPFTATFAGAGSSADTQTLTTGAVGRIGVISCMVGTTTTGASQILTAPSIIRFGSGGTWIFDASVAIGNALPDGTETFTVRVGFLDAASSAVTDGAFFFLDNNSASWICKNSSNSVVTSATASAGNPTADVFQHLRIVVVDATSATFFVDGTQVAQNTTNLPNGVGRELGFGLGAIKSAGTTSRGVRCDWLQVEYISTALIRA